MTSTSSMRCDAVRTALVERAATDWADLEPHLGGCPACAALRADILAAEAELHDALDDFAQRGDVDAALRRARQARPPIPDPAPRSWRIPIMATVVLASAAAALLLLAPWAPTPSPVDGTVGIEVATPAHAPSTAPSAAVDDSPEPVVPMPVAPTPPHDDAVAMAPEDVTEREEGTEAEGPSTCGDPSELEVGAMKGKLDHDTVACLQGLLGPDSRADAVPVLRLLTVYAFAGADEEAWERYALQLASITEDPDLHYKLSLYYAKSTDTAPMSLHHADIALGMADRWPEAIQAKRVGSLLKLRAAGTLRLLMDAPTAATQTEAADAARAWLRHDRREGLPVKTSRKACVALADADWCDAD